MKPVLIINNHDYAPYIEELNLSSNDLDADGSGRDVTTGEMHRTIVATKLKADVKLLRIQQPTMTQLKADLSGEFYTATVLNPATGNRVTKTFYTSAVPYGAQRYNKHTGAPYYDGVTFSMTER